MALVTCPDCGKSISDAAPACPQCGRPMTPPTSKVITTPKGQKIRVPISSPSQPMAPVGSASIHQPVQIEKTSKPLKAQGCLSGIVIAIAVVLGIAAVSSNPENKALGGFSTLLLVIGFVWFVVTRIRIWWRHD